MRNYIARQRERGDLLSMNRGDRMTSIMMSRAADVAIKERRRPMLTVRDTPLYLGHLRTMTCDRWTGMAAECRVGMS